MGIASKSQVELPDSYPTEGAFKMRLRIFKGKKNVEQRNVMEAKDLKDLAPFATEGDFQVLYQP